jgi:hypothetical protein
MTLAFAFRHIAAATEQEQLAIFSSMAEHLHGEEGERAARALHHKLEAQTQQMLLGELLAEKSPTHKPGNDGNGKGRA